MQLIVKNCDLLTKSDVQRTTKRLLNRFNQVTVIDNCKLLDNSVSAIHRYLRELVGE